MVDFLMDFFVRLMFILASACVLYLVCDLFVRELRRRRNGRD